MAIELSRGMKSRAVRAINSVHAAYYETDGIRDLEARISEKRASAAKHIYSLAVFAFKETRKRDDAIELYLELCAHAEAEYKREHDVENLADALPTWKTLKSNVLTGIRDDGLDPRKFRSEGAFRVAKMKKRAAAAEAPAAPETASNVIQLQRKDASPEDFDAVLATTVHEDTLRVLVAQIVFEVGALKLSTIAEAEDILRETMDRLAPLVDKRKVA